MNTAALVLHQLRFDQRIFWRNPASVFFTVLFPLIFLFLFAGIFGNQRIETLGVTVTTYYVPAIITLAVVSATLVSLAMSLVIAREGGRLKRVRGTPLPGWVFISGRVGNSVAIATLMVAVVAAVGWIVFGVELSARSLPGLLLSLLVASFAFCSLGFALSALIPSEDAAAPITNATVLPLYFLSGVFIPESEIPAGALRVADTFPIRPLFEAFFAAFDPAGSGVPIEWGSLAVVAAWGVAGLLVALRAFRFSPRRD